MKTFGELVSQIKVGLLDLCNDLSGKGTAQSLGPAHAYGKSFLILQSVRTLKEAIQNQENILKTIDKENIGSTQSGDSKAWRVVDSIFQSLSLIDRYFQDPSGHTHRGIVESLKQEASICGLKSEISKDGSLLVISGRTFRLNLSLDENGIVVSAKLQIEKNDIVDEFDVFSDIINFLEKEGRMHEHAKHLFTIAARLDAIENEHYTKEPLHKLSFPTNLTSMRMSFGGMVFPFVHGFETLLTFDHFEQERRMPMIVIDPPIIFPYENLRELQDICGVRFGIEPLVAVNITSILNVKTDVIKMINGKPVKLILSDNEIRNCNVTSIKLARLPIGNLNAFDHIVLILKKAALWCSIITDTFQTSDVIEGRAPAVDIGPNSDFSLSANHWELGDKPSHTTIHVTDEGLLTTSSNEINSRIQPSTTFLDIIGMLIQ